MPNPTGTGPRDSSSSGWIWTSAGSVRWQINRAYAQPAFLRRLAEPDLLTGAPSIPLREDTRPRSTHLVRAVYPEFSAPVIIKLYRYRNLWQSFKEAVRGCRARRAFEQAIFLQQRGIPTATPIAAGEIRRQAWRNESYLFSEEVPLQRLRELRSGSGESILGRRLMRALARTMATLHEAGLSHSDTSLSNFLVKNELSKAPELVLIDLDGLRRHRRISQRRAEKDLKLVLHRIRMTPREQLWFLAQYSRSRLAGPSARALCGRFDFKL